MQTNPYEATGNHEPIESHFASKFSARIPPFVCVISVLIAVPLVALWAIRIINSLVVSNMGLWESILLFFSLIAAVPIGFLALMIGSLACRGRWPIEIVVSTLLLLGTFPLIYKLIARIAFWRSSSILGLYSSLISSIAIGPVLIGILLYCILRRGLVPYRALDSNEVLDRRSDPM